MQLQRQAADAALPKGLATAVSQLAGAGDVDDAQLVARSLRGDQDAFAAIVARYQKRAFWIAFHVVGRVEDARDVAQESFVRLYRSLQKYDFGRSFYTWFYRIVMNLAIDALRKNKSSHAVSLEDFQAGLPDGDDGPAPAERAEQNGMVWRVLERLDAKFRTVIVLRDIHGMSCREIAPILSITHATVRWRLHRGRQIFKDHWERSVGRPRR
jgi:RNA polymerase sigma-70 factor (ECF subfamily)